MPKIKRHYPNFVDIIDEPEIVDFSTTEELLAISFVKSNLKYKEFFRFSISPHPTDSLLIAEFKKDKVWYVLGHINDVSNIDLPKWVKVRSDE